MTLSKLTDLFGLLRFYHSPRLFSSHQSKVIKSPRAPYVLCLVNLERKRAVLHGQCDVSGMVTGCDIVKLLHHCQWHGKPLREHLAYPFDSSPDTHMSHVHNGGPAYPADASSHGAPGLARGYMCGHELGRLTGLGCCRCHGHGRIGGFYAWRPVLAAATARLSWPAAA